MKYWQKKRNYRKQQNEDGAITFIITIDGQDVEVTEEVYLAYSQLDRRERYQEERDEGVIVPLSRLDEDLTGYAETESAEDVAIRNIRSGQAMHALNCLKTEDQRLIHALIIDGKTERDYATALDISQVAVHKRKQRALKKLQKLF